MGNVGLIEIFIVEGGQLVGSGQVNKAPVCFAVGAAGDMLSFGEGQVEVQELVFFYSIQ